MPAALFALITAFFFALHNVLIKKGLKTSNPATAVFITLGVNMILLWAMGAFLHPLHSLATPGTLVFVAVGLFQPGLTRLLTAKSIEKVGVAITDPIRATTPMFSSLLAILFLDENMTLAIFGGTLLIILGIALLSYPKEGTRRIELRYVLYPVFASFLVGLSQVARKFGLEFIPHPSLAAAVTATSSFTVISILLWFGKKKDWGLSLNKESLRFYLAAGVVISLGMASLYNALTLGEVVVVIPITSSGPLFALTLSALFLRDTEKVTFRIAMGACLIVGGVFLVTLLK